MAITTIEITFPRPVDLKDDEMRSLVELADILCRRYQRLHPGRIMWPFGVGHKPTFIPMTPEEERERGIEFDEGVFHIQCSEREDYAAKCARCGMEQGDHAHCISNPPAGDCEFVVLKKQSNTSKEGE